MNEAYSEKPIEVKEEISSKLLSEKDSSDNDSEEKDKEAYAKWINNEGQEVENVFGFNENAELVNARAAMFGFLMLILTELIFKGAPVTHSIFAIN